MKRSLGERIITILFVLSCDKILEFENNTIEKTLSKLCDGMELKLIDHSIQVFATCTEKVNCNIQTRGV